MKNTPLIQNQLIQNQLIQAPITKTGFTPNPFVSPTIQKPGIEANPTAGTVRVNNLANLEQLLFYVSIGLAVLLLAVGGNVIYRAYQNKKANLWMRVRGYALGTGLIAFGLNSPYMISWLVASARDAPLCGGMF